MQEETFKTTSGKEMTVTFSDSGEPEKVSWKQQIGEGFIDITLSENEVYDIYEYFDSLDEKDD